jgi:hypothetical protein
MRRVLSGLIDLLTPNHFESRYVCWLDKEPARGWFVRKGEPGTVEIGLGEIGFTIGKPFAELPTICFK